jgi:toluene monooxygenase system ferredoxin subunit
MKKICTRAQLSEGEMRDFELDGREFIITWIRGDEPKAYDAACPHQGISLAFGEFDGQVIVCSAHDWSFDAATGRGVFPEDCQLQARPLKIIGDDVLIEIEETKSTMEKAR